MDFTWVTSAGDIEGVTAGVGISGGGTSGTVTITNDMATTITTAGDLIKGTGSGTYDRLGIGSTGQVLTVSGGAPAWVSPAGGGKVLQVVMGTTGTAVTANNGTYVDTNLTATITPSSATSKVLALVAQNGCYKSSGNAANGINLRLLRAGSNIITFAYEGLSTNTTINNAGSFPVMYLDSPATTSATIYKTQFSNGGVSANLVGVNSNATSTIILMEIGA